ncbi:MAG: hypothetical protein INQ03_06915 [Candidatus Heimdallarchaeota archaeon]|nr:hypothetical protein [Candidatus Heimdallarchaeota archaeon]
MKQERYKIATITDDVTALGMRLSGIGEVSSVKDGETGSDIISTYANDPSIAVIIITEEIAAENRALINKITLRPWPVIVEIPGPDGKIEKESSAIKELVKRALGIEMDI